MLGDVMTDVVARTGRPLAVGSDTPASVAVVGGGSAANVAVRAAALGAATVLVGRVGDDAFGDRARRELLAARVGLALTVDPDRPTGTCVVLVGPDGERTMLPDAGANAVWSPSDVPADLVAGARHLHVVGYSLLRDRARDAARSALRIAREHGVPTSVDPSSAAPLLDVGARSFLDWTRGVDLLIANAAEAAVLTGEDDPAAAAVALTQSYAEAVVKAGADGAHRAGRDADPVHVPARPVDVVDSTGAGDAFAAAYLWARVRGVATAAALSEANTAAGETLGHAGARTQ